MGAIERGSMRLADFVDREREAILAEWVTFAATMLPAASDMGALELRDHAPKILDAISKDLRSRQTREAQHAKAQGRAPAVVDAPETAAEIHAVLRARSGFDINQLVAEYRALRASVLRLWIDQGPAGLESMNDMRRFNEAIDQAIAESVRHFDDELQHARNLLLGMLGHDMRSPLTTVLTTAGYLQMLDAGPQVAAAAERLVRSGHSLKTLLDDLVDFSRTRLGLGLKVQPTRIAITAVVTDELEQLRGAYPDRTITLEVPGEEYGEWDGERVQQLVRNLVSNAIRHGSPHEPVQLRIEGDATSVYLTVTNRGRSIEPAAHAEIFSALKRGSEHSDGMGLGLFIVSTIAAAHGGEVGFRSVDGETEFKVRLPRVAPVH